MQKLSKLGLPLLHSFKDCPLFLLLVEEPKIPASLALARRQIQIVEESIGVADLDAGVAGRLVVMGFGVLLGEQPVAGADLR